MEYKYGYEVLRMSEISIKILAQLPNQDPVWIYKKSFEIEGSARSDTDFSKYYIETLKEAISKKTDLSNLARNFAYITQSNGENSIPVPRYIYKGFDFGNAKLSGANFSEFSFLGNELTKADIRGANFTKAKFEAADFTGQNLDNVNFTSAVFNGPAKFINCTGSKVIFDGVKGAKAIFDASNFDSPSFAQSNFSESTGTKFTWVDPGFDKADFSKSVWVAGKLLFTKESRVQNQNQQPQVLNLRGGLAYLCVFAGLNGIVPKIMLDTMNSFRAGGNIFHDIEFNMGGYTNVAADFSGARPHRMLNEGQNAYLRTFKGWDVMDLPPYFANIKIADVAPDGVPLNIFSGFKIAGSQKDAGIQHFVSYDPVFIWNAGDVFTKTDLSHVLGASLTTPRQAALYPPEKDTKPVIDNKPNTLENLAKNLNMPAYIGDTSQLQAQVNALKDASRTEGQTFAQTLETAYLRLVTGVITSGIHTFKPRTAASDALQSLADEFNKFSFVTPSTAQRLYAEHKANAGTAVPPTERGVFSQAATSQILSATAPLKESADGKIDLCADLFDKLVVLMKDELETSTETSQSIENISSFAEDLNLRLRAITDEARNMLPAIEKKRPKMFKTVTERLDDLDDTLADTDSFAKAFDGVLTAELSTMRTYQRVITDALPSLNTNIMILLSSDKKTLQTYLAKHGLEISEAVSAFQTALASLSEADREKRLDAVREDTIQKIGQVTRVFDAVDRERHLAVLNLADVTGAQPFRATFFKPVSAPNPT